METGRWNRRGRGRLPLEERQCVCGGVQTEKHVIELCPFSYDVRQNYNFVTLEDLFSGRYDNLTICKVIHDILNLYI